MGDIQQYFSEIKRLVEQHYDIANMARSKGFDPKREVEIPTANDFAARVEKLVGPDGIAERIRHYLKNTSREETAISVAVEIAEEGGRDVEKTVEQAVRTGLAILTEGVLVAPIEGISEVKIAKNFDSSSYIELYFAGPIRSAGGTGEAMSVLIADIVRRKLGIDRYKPTEDEVERYKEEVPFYDRIATLQYAPSTEEIENIVRNCPVCINGEATEDREVMGKRDLPRVKTNNVRGGACLVIAEGLCLKAPKILKHVSRMDLEGWDFLKGFLHDNGEKKDVIVPSSKYISSLIAGRPVFSHPSAKGGFRLRYGRGRTCGLASTAINPAAMNILDGFVAIGTQIKTERPGKGTVGTTCDSIEGPMVLLRNGDFVQVNTPREAKEVGEDVKEIIDLGEILIPFGEFVENNAILPQSSYCHEWWIQELEEAIGCTDDDEAKEAVSRKLGHDISIENPSPEDAFLISEEYGVPLHPSYNLFWHDIVIEDIKILVDALAEAAGIAKTDMKGEDRVEDKGTGSGVERDGNGNGITDTVVDGDENMDGGGLPFDGTLKLQKDGELKEILLKLGALHLERDRLVLGRYAYPVIRGCGFHVENGVVKKIREFPEGDDPMETVSKLSGVKIMPRAPHRIGTRMGRPEKAAERTMRATPHVLFPVGAAGGRERLVNSAARANKIKFEAGTRRCPKCGKTTYRRECDCGALTLPTGEVALHEVKLYKELERAKDRIGMVSMPNKVKGVIGLSSRNKTPECLEKGLLRAKHGVYVFKDGTARFDMTNVPLTHFKPREIGTSVEKLRELGYDRDWKGMPLERDEQICELKVQDVVPSGKCGVYMLHIANYIDELLEKFYSMETFYNASTPDDMVGRIVVGMSPHTSAGAVGRIIGFADADICFAHPFYHAAKRRNCDGDEDTLMLLLDVLINFSLEYIPEKRGGHMDLPLVLTTRISPAEVDKEAQNIDLLPRYPLNFYRATIQHSHPKEVEKEMDLVAGRIGTGREYDGFAFTHDTGNISEGVKTSSYKTLKTMEDKLNAQLELARKIRAVDESDVATRVIQTHFLPDLIGNLRAFSTQQVRCVKCNKKYRRMPLKGACTYCGGALTLTVHEKSIKKYLEPAKRIMDRFNVPDYTKQRILVFEKAAESLFHNDSVKKPTLDEFLN